MDTNEKYMYRIIAQKTGITITAETSNDVTFDEAKTIGIADVLGGVDKLVNFEPFVVLPITTKERWDEGTINFCPRCGKNLGDYGLETYGNFDCDSCGASMEVQIHRFSVDE